MRTRWRSADMEEFRLERRNRRYEKLWFSGAKMQRTLGPLSEGAGKNL